LSPQARERIFTLVNFKDGTNVVGILTTIGRKTGQPRMVELRFLYYGGTFYATSSRVQGKHWCQNMIKNPKVDLALGGEKLSCVAEQVTDDRLRRQILTLRDSPPQLDRVVFEIRSGG
jgi:deazaflavin-dependent oxidoreductase (nitroreductase family)